jgi:hypothetical protein
MKLIVKTKATGTVETVEIDSWTKHQYELHHKIKFSQLAQKGIGYSDAIWMLWKQWSDDGKLAGESFTEFGPTVNVDFALEDDSENPTSEGAKATE